MLLQSLFLQTCWHDNLQGYDFIYADPEQMDFYQLKDREDNLLQVTKSQALIAMYYSQTINTTWH